MPLPCPRPILTLLALLHCLGAPALAGDELPPDVARLLAERGEARLWVFLADKGVEDLAAALAQAEAALPERTLARRAARRSAPGLVDARDLPVAASYRAAVASTGARIGVESRWLNALSVTADAAQARALLALPGVTQLRPVARSVGVDPGLLSPLPPATPAAAGWSGTLDYGYAQDQTGQLDLHKLHLLGHTGVGVVIGVLDSGFATTHEAFHQPGAELEVIASWDFVDDDAEVGPEGGDDPDQHSHGTLILGMLAAAFPGSLVGAAPDAAYILCKTEDITDEYPAEEDFYVAGLEFAEFHGADVATSSLGYIDWYDPADMDGLTAPVSVAVNAATANGVHCCTAAGNFGHDGDPGTLTLIAPGDAFDVLTCGAVDVLGDSADFTSDGPSADGRVKPELLAMGVDTITVWPYDDVNYTYASGTSLSTPLLAGVVACLAGAHPEWSVASLRERLTKTADAGATSAPDPLFVRGFGVVDADDALALAGSFVPLGGALAGSNGVPLLSGSGSLVADESTLLQITHGKPGGSAWFIVGLTLLDAPFKGGVLKPSLDVVQPPLALDGSGALALVFPWAPGLPAGTAVHTQAWIPDAAGPAGFSSTQGLSLVTP